MGTSHLKSVYPYLVVLLETLSDLNLRKQLLRQPKVLACISEITYNILKENVTLSDKEKQKLKKYKRELCSLASKISARKKEKLLTGQRGGGLLKVLLAIGIPALISLLSTQK
ncbi:MAG: hypothetical protein GY804_04335 [Alphaproteobacteria bacterium]|nr:hypothetical protein [Alphaproteobacteria bacterium]